MFSGGSTQLFLLIPGRRTSNSSFEGESYRTKDAESRRSSVTLPALVDESINRTSSSTEPTLTIDKSILCDVPPAVETAPQSESATSSIPPVKGPDSKMTSPACRRKRNEVAPTGFISKTLASHFVLPREKSFLSNQNITLPFEENRIYSEYPNKTQDHQTMSSSSTASVGSVNSPPVNHKMFTNRVPVWLPTGDRQKTMMSHGSGHNVNPTEGGLHLNRPSRAAMVALQRSRTLSSFSSSAILGNNPQQPVKPTEYFRSVSLE